MTVNGTEAGGEVKKRHIRLVLMQHSEVIINV